MDRNEFWNRIPEIPKPPWWMYAIGLVGGLIYIAFIGLVIAALGLGVYWLYGQVTA